MSAWVDDHTFRCIGANPRVRGLQIPLALVRAVLPFEQFKRFSIRLHDDSIHTFRVLGATAAESSETLRLWVDLIGRASAQLQRRRQLGGGGMAGHRDHDLVYDPSALPSRCSPDSDGTAPRTPGSAGGLFAASTSVSPNLGGAARRRRRRSERPSPP